jgi:RHS repeat-associated protein
MTPEATIERERSSRRHDGFQWTPRDQSANLWLAMYRAYDADLGRWLSDDPIGAPSANAFGYIKNNRLAFYDPDGLDTITDNPEIRKCLCELWKDANYGFDSRQRAAWLLKANDVLSCQRWPWYVLYHRR